MQPADEQPRPRLRPWRRAWARPAIDQLLEARGQSAALRRHLGAWDITLLGIGAIIGAGVFTTLGTAAAGDALRPGAGPSLALSFVITAAACAVAALSYAELAAMVPTSGSAYTYTTAAMGEGIGWLVGWNLMLEYAISNVAVAISWANYFRVFLGHLGLHVPLWLATDPRTARDLPEVLASAPRLFGVPVVLNLLAFSVTAVLTGVLVLGVRASARLGGLMVWFKVVVLMLFVGAALSRLPGGQAAANLTPFFPEGMAGTLAGAAIVFFAFIGFDTVSTVAEETRDPGRTLPRGIVGSLVACTALYVAVALSFSAMLPWPVLRAHPAQAQGEPLTFALGQLGHSGQWVEIAVALGAVVAQTATLLVYQMGQPRIFLAMARDGLMPPWFARVHPRFGTPHVTTVFTGLAVATASCVMTIEELIDLTNVGTLATFVLVCLAIPILRHTDADRPRPFRVPWGPRVLPLSGAVGCLGLIAYLPETSWWRFVAWLLAGAAVYLMYGIHHSRLGQARDGAVGVDGPTRLAGGALAVVAAALFARSALPGQAVPWGMGAAGGGLLLGAAWWGRQRHVRA